MTWAIPTISAIQRANVILVALAAVLLGLFVSRAAAWGCLLGGTLVIANLFILSMLGALVLAAAGGGGTAHRAGALALPLKLLLLAALVYLIFSRIRIDAIGFGLGVLTQLLAILIETWRVAIGPAHPAH